MEIARRLVDICVWSSEGTLGLELPSITMGVISIKTLFKAMRMDEIIQGQKGRRPLFKPWGILTFRDQVEVEETKEVQLQPFHATKHLSSLQAWLHMPQMLGTPGE